MSSGRNAGPPVRLSLEEDQLRLLHGVACELVVRAAGGQAVAGATSLPDALAEVPVTGVFVTLWGDGRLRGCMGNVAPTLPLGVALRRAANSVVRDDPRFPVVTVEEVDGLTLELSVLHAREALGSTASERLAGLVIGEHGLDIEYHARCGLLLPRVPVELGWDKSRFLEEVCRKADLPPETWRDPGAAVFRFSAYCVGGQFAGGSPTRRP